ncbi:hypothetical protein CMV_019834 [Castanea mollissima]|uniref:Uncharacterized protein n=1 Tax=Castanea mollissima TaxID=60419 RepID=A0A8J4QNE3_9ROSI|nr:hypothetical protein CMV_019834 [Castanea mollissima]
MRPRLSLLDVNKRNIGCKQDDLSYISNYYKMGSLISKDQFEFLEMEYVVWPLADCELLQPTTESACQISCVQLPFSSNQSIIMVQEDVGRRNYHFLTGGSTAVQLKEKNWELASSHNKYVAVRKLDKKVREDGREFKIDMTMIGQTHHKNLVQLLGYCDEGKVERLVENNEEALSDLKWVKKLLMVAIWCIQDVPPSRPSMREVNHMLEGILEISTPHVLYSSTSEPDFQSS